MLYAGSQIVSSTDKLQKVSLDYVVNRIKNPQPLVEQKIRQLRTIRQIDPQCYRNLKKELPYIVCAVFNPPYRRTENFAYTEYFILDIDHISDKQMSPKSLRERLQNDDQVVMCFISPGEDGLKLLFKLDERCYDPGLYSLFYKLFAEQFSQKYDLLQLVDARTSDVCRACFVSHDQDVYYNPSAAPVKLKDFMDPDNPYQLFRQKKMLQKKEEELKASGDLPEKDHAREPDQAAIDKIKEILKFKKPVVEKPVYVPKELDEIMEALTAYIEPSGLQLSEVRNISYGKKLRFILGHKQAEINLFFGKRGFSVVQSPRTGTDAELNELAMQLIQSFFN